MYQEDKITKSALKIIEEAEEILETKEIEKKIAVSARDITRTKLFARLSNLRGEGRIKGKFVGPGKGVWIWWKKSAFPENKNSANKNSKSAIKTSRRKR